MAKGTSVKKETRRFRGSDMEMTLCLIIMLGYLLDNLVDITAEYPAITQTVADDNKTEVETVMQANLGLNPKKNLTHQTFLVLSMMRNAKTEFAHFHKLLMAEFVDNKGKLANIEGQLGIDIHWEAAQNGDQSQMIELLMKFDENMTPNLINILTTGSAMIPVTLINTIRSYPIGLRDYEIDQEMMKKTISGTFADIVSILNTIYAKNIKIFKYCRALYVKKKDAVRSGMFSYSSVLKSMRHEVKKTTPPPVIDNV